MAWNLELPDAEWYTNDHPDLGCLIQELEEDVPILALDTETTGLDINKDVPLFWSLSWGQRRICMPSETLPHFKHILEDPNKKWVFANAKYDTHILANIGTTIQGSLIDIQVMHALLYDDQPHGLKHINETVMGWVWKDFKDTFRFNKAGTLSLNATVAEVKKGGSFRTVQDAIMWCYHNALPDLIEYASNDAYGTMQSYYELDKRLKSSNIHSLYPDVYGTLADYFYKIEMPFTKVLYSCERHGVRVDQDYLDQIEEPVVKDLRALSMEINKTAGRMLNPNSTPDLRKYFYEEQGMKIRKMTKGGKSGKQQGCLDAEVLEVLSCENPVANLIVQYRELDKLLGTYVKGLSAHMDHEGRIHSRLNQDIARCMPAGELVLTARGYLPVEQVHVGDTVLAHTGKPRKVTDTSVHAPTPIYKVQLANGLELRTNGEHPYQTPTGWVAAKDLCVGTPVTVHSDAEQWKEIPDWPPYEVSSWGRVRNSKTRVVRALQPKGTWGHLKVTLARNGSQKRGKDHRDFAVHRLVLAAFGTQGDGETRHLNGIAWDNTVGNLTYGTSHENTQDALRHGTMSQRRAGRTTLTDAAVQHIRGTPRKGQPPSVTAKLSQQIADEIRLKRTGAKGEATALAQEYGVSLAAMCNILNGKTWVKRNAPTSCTALELAHTYGVSEGYIREVQSGSKWRPEDYIEGVYATFYDSPIVSICIEPARVTYGLTVEEDHSHVTGGVVTHNTGRLSSSDPNLQNIPNPERDKFKIRRAFIPRDGYSLLVADYDTLEMRLLACASMEPSMIEMIRAGRDIHMGNATMVFGKVDGFDYAEIAAAKKMHKQVAEGKVPESALTVRMHQLLRRRVEIKQIGFGQPTSQAEVKPHQNGELFAARAA